MIYAGSPTLDGPALRRPRRGPLPPEPLPRRGLGGGDHPPAPEVELVCLSATVSNAEEFAEWIATVRGATDGDHRGAPTGRAHAPLPGGGARRDGAPPAADVRRRTAASCGRTPRRRGSTRRDAARRRGRGRPRSRLCTPGGSRSSSCSREEQMLPAIEFVFSRAACDHAVEQCLAGGLRLTTPTSGASSAASPRPRPTRSPTTTSTCLGYDEWLAGLEAGLRRPPRRPGAADEGGGGGGVRRRAGQGRVRHRDAVARHQHAGPVGGHREAHEVHRRAPRVPDAGGVHPAHGPGGAARASTTSGTPSCCWSPFVPFDQVAGLASRRTVRAARRRSARRTTWRPTSCAGTRATRAPPPEPVVRAVPRRPRRRRPRARSWSAPRSCCAASARRPTTDGDIEEYRALLRRRARRRRDGPAAAAAIATRSTRSAPGDVLVVRRRGGRAVVLKHERAAAARRACWRSATSRARRPAGADDFDAPPAARRPRSSCPSRTRPRSPAFQRGAVESLRRVKVPTPTSRAAGDATHDRRELEAVVRRAPGARSDPERDAAPAGRGRGRTARTRRRPPRAARRAAAARAWPASSTACSGVLEAGATSTAGR